MKDTHYEYWMDFNMRQQNSSEKWGNFGVEHLMKKYCLANFPAGCAAISSCAREGT